MVNSLIRYREYGFMKWLVLYTDDVFNAVNNPGLFMDIDKYATPLGS